MNIYLKQFLIIVTIFLLILWVQNIDDNMKNKKRETTYDKIKLPLLVSAIIGLLLNINLNNLFNYKNTQDILIITPNCIENQEVYLDLDF